MNVGGLWGIAAMQFPRGGKKGGDHLARGGWGGSPTLRALFRGQRNALNIRSLFGILFAYANALVPTACIAEESSIALIHRIQTAGTFSEPTLYGEDALMVTEVSGCTMRIHTYFSRDCNTFGKIKEEHLLIELRSVLDLHQSEIRGRLLIRFKFNEVEAPPEHDSIAPYLAGALYCDGTLAPLDEFEPSISIPVEGRETFSSDVEKYVESNCR